MLFHSALLGDVPWRRDVTVRDYILRVPRGPQGRLVVVRSTFLLEACLRPPGEELWSRLRAAVDHLAPNLPPEAFSAVMQSYMNLWDSHEIVIVPRVPSFQMGEWKQAPPDRPIAGDEQRLTGR